MDLEVHDVARYAAEIADARRHQANLLVGLFIMPPNSPVPNEAFRKAQAGRLAEIMSNLQFAVAVFEGTGFILALKRSALVGILLLAPKHYSIHVRASVEQALIVKPPGPISFDARRAVDELKKQQLC
jgi:hypothetical protein